MFQKHTAARLGATIAPPVGGALRVQRAGADRGDLPEFRVADELVERLHVGTEAMVVPHHQTAIGLLRRSQAPLDAARRERERTLTQHVQLLAQRR